MTPQASTPGTAQARLDSGVEWLLVAGLAATLVWTTLCLGGYLAETMVGSAWAMFGLATLGGVRWLLSKESGPVSFHRAALLPVPFLLYALASVFWLAPARWLAWREWLLWLQMWLVFVLVLHSGRGRRPTWVIIGTLAALGLTGVGMAAYQRYGDETWMMLGRTQAEQFFGRSAGMFGIPNSLAGLLELMIPLCLALVFSRTTKVMVKVICGWLAGLFVFGLVLTGSRGGWLSLGGALVWWPLLGGRDWRRRLAGAAVVAGVAGAGLWSLYRFSAYAHDRIQPFLEGRWESSRPIIWKVGWQIWRDHFWLGGGAASYNVLFDQYRPRGFWNEPDWTHNDYLNTLSDYGAAGFGLWALAGGMLLWLGWRAVQRSRTEGDKAADLFSSGEWKLGLFLGLLAFAFHVAVDFHTKLPALAYAAAIVTALLLRDESGLCQPMGAGWRRGVGLGLALTSLASAGFVAAPLYRAEALRYASRRAIDKNARTGKGDLKQIIPAALADFKKAVSIDPANGQAWSDLSYATTLSWHLGKGDLVGIGRRAELAAERALELCRVNAEFWVRKGVALDMQARHREGETCFEHAVSLAPSSAVWWYHYAYHLSVFPERKAEALRAVESCLSLDPSNSAGVALRQQLTAGR